MSSAFSALLDFCQPWLQRWLGMGSTSQVELDPLLPISLLGWGFVGMVAFVLWLLWKEWSLAQRPRWLPLLAVLRLLACLGILIALLNPNAVTRQESKQGQHVAIAVDTSASMSVARPSDPATNFRWGKANSSPSLLDEAVGHLSAAKILAAQANETADPLLFKDTWKKLGGAISSATKSVQKAARESEVLAPRLDPWLQEAEQALQPALTSVSADSRQQLASLSAQLQSLLTRLSSLADTEVVRLAESDSVSASQERLSPALAWLSSSEDTWMKRISAEASIDRLRFDAVVSPLASDWSSAPRQANSETAVTDLSTVLNDLGSRVSQRQLDAAVMVTDGLHTASIEEQSVPPTLASTPLFVIPVGNQIVRQRDLFLRQLDAPSRVILGDQVVVRALISATELAGTKVVVELLEGTELVTTSEIQATSARHFQYAELKYQPTRRGVHELRVRLRPVDGEATLDNNERPLRLQAVDAQVQVFIADASPRWETRYLLNLFKREKQSQASGILFSPLHAFPGKKTPEPPVLPYGLEAWQQFNVVVLGDLSPNQLTPAHLKTVSQYVENGGHLVVIAGREYMPQAFSGGLLAQLLPVEPHPNESGKPLGTFSGWRAQLTEDGMAADAMRLTEDDPGGGAQADAALWRTVFTQLPVHELNRWCRPKPSAKVLLECAASGSQDATGPQRAFLATHSFGQGSVTYFSSPSTWHLRMARGDRYHYQFWGQLTRALASGELSSRQSIIRLDTDKFSYAPGEPITARLRLRKADGTAINAAEVSVIARHDGKILGTAPARPDGKQPGQYIAVLDNLQASGPIEIVPDGPEIARLQQQRDSPLPVAPILITASAVTAEAAPPTEPPSFFTNLARSPMAVQVAPAALPAALEHFSFTSSKKTILEKAPVWPRWSLLLSILAFLALEWTGRKLCGLI